MTQQRRRLGRRFIAVSTALMAVFVLYALISLKGYDTLSLPNKSDSTATPGGAYQDVSFPTRNQNYPVYAFYFPANKAGSQALISVHGYRGSRRDDYHLKRATYLRGLGYTVLSIDLSDSGGDTVDNGRISMGYSERWDVLGAFDYLLTRGFAPGEIGLVGESMGAASVLLAGNLEPRIRAIWADSPYERADTVISEQAESSGFPRIIVPGGMVWGWLLVHDRIWEIAPIDAGPAFAANKQAIYLIHCEDDQRVYYHHSVDLNAAYQAAGVDVTFWSVPDGGHASAILNHQEEYLKRLDGFFKQHLVYNSRT
jgi:uncharacterized protein